MNATIPCTQTELVNVKINAAIEAIDFAAESREILASYAYAEEILKSARLNNQDCVRFVDNLTEI